VSEEVISQDESYQEHELNKPVSEKDCAL